MCVDYLRIADDIAYKPNRSELVEISEDSDQNDPNDPLVQNLRLSGFRHVWMLELTKDTCTGMRVMENSPQRYTKRMKQRSIGPSSLFRVAP